MSKEMLAVIARELRHAIQCVILEKATELKEAKIEFASQI